jgi:hypothetical protein
MPISSWRLDARASSMLATLAQAISSTSATTVISAAAIGTTTGSSDGWKWTSLVERARRGDRGWWPGCRRRDAPSSVRWRAPVRSSRPA